MSPDVMAIRLYSKLMSLNTMSKEKSFSHKFSENSTFKQTTNNHGQEIVYNKQRYGSGSHSPAKD
jgi:hypothetical protein